MHAPLLRMGRSHNACSPALYAAVGEGGVKAGRTLCEKRNGVAARLHPAFNRSSRPINLRFLRWTGRGGGRRSSLGPLEGTVMERHTKLWEDLRAGLTIAAVLLAVSALAAFCVRLLGY